MMRKVLLALLLAILAPAYARAACSTSDNLGLTTDCTHGSLSGIWENAWNSNFNRLDFDFLPPVYATPGLPTTVLVDDIKPSHMLAVGTPCAGCVLMKDTTDQWVWSTPVPTMTPTPTPTSTPTLTPTVTGTPPTPTPTATVTPTPGASGSKFILAGGTAYNVVDDASFPVNGQGPDFGDGNGQDDQDEKILYLPASTPTKLKCKLDGGAAESGSAQTFTLRRYNSSGSYTSTDWECTITNPAEDCTDTTGSAISEGWYYFRSVVAGSPVNAYKLTCYLTGTVD